MLKKFDGKKKASELDLGNVNAGKKTVRTLLKTDSSKGNI